MQVLKNELVVFTDIDDTLVIWTDKPFEPSEGSVKIVDPYDQSPLYLVPHTRHIKLLADYKARGYTVIAWSANGYAYVETVIKTLGIESTIDIAMSKPGKYMDDLHAKDILGQRVYIPFMGIE